MLTNARVAPVLPVADMDRARGFYSKSLGLKEAGKNEADGSLTLTAGDGARIQLLPRPDAIHDDHTAATFEVSDLESEVADLEKRGVRFEDYDMPGLKTEGHIARVGNEKAAWFKDSEGNVLCLHQA